MKRFVITHIGLGGERVITFARQGRNTYGSKKDAQRILDAFLDPEIGNDIAGLYGPQSIGTFEVRAVECWDNHDPKSCYCDP